MAVFADERAMNAPISCRSAPKGKSRTTLAATSAAGTAEDRDMMILFFLAMAVATSICAIAATLSCNDENDAELARLTRMAPRRVED